MGKAKRKCYYLDLNAGDEIFCTFPTDCTMERAGEVADQVEGIKISRKSPIQLMILKDKPAFRKVPKMVKVKERKEEVSDVH